LDTHSRKHWFSYKFNQEAIAVKEFVGSFLKCILYLRGSIIVHQIGCEDLHEGVCVLQARCQRPLAAEEDA
jgi:hypothetical protein